MRILVSAGTSQSLVGFRLPLLRELRRRGHDVYACAPNDDASVAAKLAKEGIQFHTVRLRRAALSPLQDIIYAWAIYTLVRRLRIQGYLAYTHKPICLGLPAAAAAGAAVRVALITGLGYGFTHGESVHRRVARAALRLLYLQALPQATGLFFQNQDDRDEFARLGLLNDAPVPELVAGSGVPLDEFHVATLPLQPVVFLMLSRLLADKGVREYAAAAALAKRSYPSARFLLAGAFDSNPSGISQAEVQSWTKSGAIEYLGVLDDVRPALRACTVYVLPSYREGTPRSALEAMATGRPILTTDAPGCRETLLNLGPADALGIRCADNGLAVPVARIEPLASAMLRFAAGGSWLQKCAESSRAYAEARFDARKVSADLAKPFSK